MMSKYVLFFLAASCTYVLQQSVQPANRWEWFKFWAGLIGQGAIACKALQSNPSAPLALPTKTELMKTATLFLAIISIPFLHGCANAPAAAKPSLAAKTAAATAAVLNAPATQQTFLDVTEGVLDYTQGNTAGTAKAGLDLASLFVRQLQGTPKAADPAAVQAAVVAAGGNADMASMLSTAIVTVRKAGAPASTANETIMKQLDAALARKPEPQTSRGIQNPFAPILTARVGFRDIFVDGRWEVPFSEAHPEFR